MTRRGAAAVVGAGAALAAVGCGGASQPGDGDGHNGVAWTGAPHVYVAHTATPDRVLVGTIRNTTGRTLRLTSDQITVRDARGDRLAADGAFTGAYAHGLFGAFQQPSRMPTKELVRLGRLRFLVPGAQTPIFAAWRQRPTTRGPLRITLGAAARAPSLDVPTATKPAAG